jgi:type II secretory pathway pseudopilin PulG
MRATLHKEKRGITSLEVVIGVSIAGIVIAFAANAIMLFLNSAREVTAQTQALYLAEDGLELLRYVRDENWNDVSSLSLGTTHYLSVTPTDVVTSGTPEVIDEFTRSFQVQNVYRNSSSDDIVASTTGGSVADTNAKYVTVTVNWGSPTENLSLTTILVNLNP